MKEPQLQERRLNIVLLGDLNPQIFQPAWFVSQKLLGDKEGESAKVEVIHPQITVFNLDWLRLEVSRDRLVATTRDERYHEILRDLIIGTFTILSHTPLRMMGINSDFDYTINDEPTWHGIGHKLAPKDIWNKVMDSPGLYSLTVGSKRNIKDNYGNIVRVTVSEINVKLGLRIHINDHYELIAEKEKILGSNEMISVLNGEWDNSQKKTLEIKNKFFEELG
jgi:hypothetical protein